MGEPDSFEERIRAIADQISRSMQRISEVDLEQLAEGYGVDVDRARSAANAASQWLSEHLSTGEPLFGQAQDDEPAAHGATPDPDAPRVPAVQPGQRPANAGPHPLDLASPQQGLALSALDSGRWVVRPGSNQLAGTGEGPPPPDGHSAPDLVGDLRARDWINADGTLTLVGRHALARWCASAVDPRSGTPATDAPPGPPPD
jgi:hypothetical protein